MSYLPRVLSYAQLRQNAHAAGHPESDLTVARQVIDNLQTEAIYVP